MQTINIHEVESHLSQLIEQAAAGEEIIIAKAGKPIARLMPLVEVEQTRRKLGLGKGKLSVPENFDTLHAEAIQAMFEGCEAK